MFLEGEVNWTLVLAAITAVSVVIAMACLWFAVTHKVRQVSTSSELDLVQKAAASADRRLKETLDAVPVALVETDAQGKFVFANRAAHQLLGRRDAELIGLRFHSATWGITFPDGRPVPPDLLPSARALRGQTVRGFQHMLANPASRRKMLVSVTAMPIEDAFGRVIGSMAAIVETEGLAMPQPEPVETALVADDGLVRRVFEAASAPLVVVDAEGRVREANPAAMALNGLSGDISGQMFAEVFVGEAERSAARHALHASLTAMPEEAPVIELAASDERPALRWRILPLDGNGERADALVLAGEPIEVPARDVIAPEPAIPAAASDQEGALLAAQAALESEREARRRLEAETRAEARSSRRLEDVGRLTGGLVQDLNALIGVMTSALDMMLKQADDPSRVRRLGQAALAAGQRGESLTRRIGAFSEGEDGVPARVMDASVLLKSMETALRSAAGPEVDLMVEAPSATVPVRLDPVIFTGAVRALVVNAAQAMDGRGSVAVRLDHDAEGLAAVVSVRDSGPGFSDEARRHAMEPFFTTRPGAQGLGLSQAHAFARQAKGRLVIDQAPGGGAEVRLILPAAQPQEADQAGDLRTA